MQLRGEPSAKAELTTVDKCGGLAWRVQWLDFRYEPFGLLGLRPFSQVSMAVPGANRRLPMTSSPCFHSHASSAPV